MAIEVDGEKYACEACIRGHRVSNCTHKDRELKHINKKGRPVSQCLHCRGMRKSRSAHIKCICADQQNGSVPSSSSTPILSLPGHTCACMSGSTCSCASSKKESHSEVNEIARTAAMNATHKRSISNTSNKPPISYRKSDSTVPHVRHSFHPQHQRMNNAHLEYGLPYPLKRASTSHDQLGMSIAPRSVDSLPLTSSSSNSSATASDSSFRPSVSVDRRYPPLPRSSEQPHLGRPILPNNVQRYSTSDISQFDWNGNFNIDGEFGNSIPTAYSVPASATESIPLTWSELDLTNSYNYNSMLLDNPQPPSVDSSVDQPSLSRSSSGTASDTAESSNTTMEFGFANMSQPSLESIGFSSSYQEGDSFLDYEDAFNQQKTPKATLPPGASSSTANDYFGNFAQSSMEANTQEWSTSTSDQTNDWSQGLLISGDSMQNWTSGLEAPSYDEENPIDENFWGN